MSSLGVRSPWNQVSSFSYFATVADFANVSPKILFLTHDSFISPSLSFLKRPQKPEILWSSHNVQTLGMKKTLIIVDKN